MIGLTSAMRSAEGDVLRPDAGLCAGRTGKWKEAVLGLGLQRYRAAGIGGVVARILEVAIWRTGQIVNPGRLGNLLRPFRRRVGEYIRSAGIVWADNVRIESSRRWRWTIRRGSRINSRYRRGCITFWRQTEPPPSGSARFRAAVGGLSAAWGLDDKIKTPYSHVIDFSIERDLGNQFSLDVAYVGRLGRRLLENEDLAMPLDLSRPEEPHGLLRGGDVAFEICPGKHADQCDSKYSLLARCLPDGSRQVRQLV